MMIHSADKALFISQKILPVGVTVLLHTGQKPGDRLHKGIIIHHRIPFIPLKPGAGVPVMLRQNQRIRIRLLHRFSESFPEIMIKSTAVSQIRGNIQTPAVNIKFPHPIAAHLAEILLYFRVAGVSFRHHALIAEAFIGRISFGVFRPLYRKLQMVKPVFIF